jgi:protein-tyrosine phosphatase
MSRFVDIHAHLLPGLDDGPDDLEGALEMARAALESGTETLAATPHVRPDLFPDVHVEELAERCERLREELSRNRIPLRIAGGAEVSLLWALDADDDALRLVTYNQGGTDLLVETPNDATMIDQLLGTLLQRGVRVTLAHPERSRFLQSHPERLEGLRDRGVVLQINAEALLARRSGGARACAEHLCREGLAQVLASDGHRGRSWRPVGVLSAGVEAASQLVGPARAQWMASDAPAAIVAGLPLPPAPEIEPHVRSWWRRRG